MQRHLPLLCTLSVLSTLAITIVPINAGDESRDSQLVVIVYPVADLPVYQLVPRGVDAQFEPTLLISLLKAELGADHWQDGRDSISQHETTRSLVIRTTRANQERLSTFMETLRRELRPANAQEEADFGVGDDLEPLKMQKQKKVSATDVSKPGKQRAVLTEDLDVLADRLTLKSPLRTSLPIDYPSEYDDHQQYLRNVLKLRMSFPPMLIAE